MNIRMSIKDVELLHSILAKELNSVPLKRKNSEQYRRILCLQHKVSESVFPLDIVCPTCDAEDALYVVNVRMAQSGKRYIMSEKLELDGFNFPQRVINAESDLSTDDVVVECECCSYRFSLSSLLGVSSEH